MADPANTSGRRSTPRLGTKVALAVAAWCGLLAGLLEVSTKVICAALGRSGRLYQMSKHFCWLIPVTNLLVFIAFGLLLAAMARLAPGFARWFGLRWLAALVILPSFLLAVPEVHGLAWLVLCWGLAMRLVPVIDRLRAGLSSRRCDHPADPGGNRCRTRGRALRAGLARAAPRVEPRYLPLAR